MKSGAAADFMTDATSVSAGSESQGARGGRRVVVLIVGEEQRQKGLVWALLRPDQSNRGAPQIRQRLVISHDALLGTRHTCTTSARPLGREGHCGVCMVLGEYNM